MFEKVIEEAKDFFEDIFEHLLEKDHRKVKETPEIIERTHLAYQFTERVDSLMKIILGSSISISAIIATVWGFTAVGDMVRMLVNNPLGRVILLFIGLSYLVNGIWRFFHARSK